MKRREGIMTLLVLSMILAICFSSSVQSGHISGQNGRQLKSSRSGKGHRYEYSKGSSSSSSSSSSDSSRNSKGKGGKSSKGGKSGKSPKGGKSAKSGKGDKSSKSGGSDSVSYSQSNKSSKSSDSGTTRYQYSAKSSKSGKSSESSSSSYSTKSSSGSGSSSSKSSKSDSSKSRKHLRYIYGKSSKSGKGGKSGNGSKSGKGGKSDKSTKMSKSAKYWADYWALYDIWKEHIYEPPTLSPTASPTQDLDGVYEHENGSIACYPFNEDGSVAYHGETFNRHIAFDYEMTVEDGVDASEKIAAIEQMFVAFLAGELHCYRGAGLGSKSSKSARKLLMSRALEVVSVNPAPSDSVEGTCGSNCANVNAAMTVTTSEQDEDLCELMDKLVAYSDSYEPGTVEGVTSVSIDENSILVGDHQCHETFVIPPVINVVQAKDKKPLLSLLLLVAGFVAVAMYVRRRRRLRAEERARLLALSDDDTDDQFQREYALNAVNVHKCNSAQCAICTGNNGTQFLNLDEVSAWVESRKTVEPTDEVELENPEIEAVQPHVDDHLDEKDIVVEKHDVEEPIQEVPFDEIQSRKSETSRLIADAKRVLSNDQVEDERYDDKLRGLPTVPEVSDSEEDRSLRSGLMIIRAEDDEGSI